MNYAKKKGNIMVKKIDLETVDEIGFEDLSESMWGHRGSLYEFVKSWFCNVNFLAGYIIKNKDSGKLIFVENNSLDSWYNGEGLCWENEEFKIYGVEKVDILEDGQLYYTLSKAPINTIDIVGDDY